MSIWKKNSGDRRVKNLPFGVEDMLERGMENWPEGFSPSLGFAARLFRLRELMIKHASRVVAPFDLSLLEFDVLASLRKMPSPYEMRPSDIYRAMLLSSGGVTKLLKGLDQRGFVTRRPDPKDSRGSLVRLTDPGKNRIEEAMQALKMSSRSFYDGTVDEETLLSLAEALKPLTSHLDR